MSSTELVRDYIARMITTGVYAANQRIEPVRKLASTVGTSIHTVQRAVIQLEYEGVLRNGPGRGYFVAARQKAAGIGTLKGAIGLALGVATNRKHDYVAPGAAVGGFNPWNIQETLHARGYAALSFCAYIKVGGQQRCLPPEEIEQANLCGLLVLNVYDLHYLKEISHVQPNVVALDVDAMDVAVDSVAFDNLGSSFAIVQELARSGARKIAFIGGGPYPPRKPARGCPILYYDVAVKQRYDGWRLGVQSAGLPADEELAFFSSGRSEAGYREKTLELLRSRKRPDAIVTEGPAAVSQALADAGFKRDECQVAGWAAQGAEDAAGAAAVVAACDFSQMTREGVDLLLQKIQNPQMPVTRRIIPVRVVRGTGVLARQ